MSTEEFQLQLLNGVTFGALLFLVATGGGDPVTLDAPPGLDGSTTVFGITYPVFRLAVLALGAIVAVGLWYLLERTRVGAMVRAGVDDRETAAALGINVSAVFTGVFVLGALLAGPARVVGGAYPSLFPGADAEILTYSLVVVVLGGLGSLRGAIAGSLLVALIYTYGQS